MRAGFNFVGLRQQVRCGGQCRELFAGGCVFGCRGGSQLFFSTHALDVALRVQGHLLAKLGNSGLNLWGLWLLLEAFALLRHVSVLALEV